MEDMIAKYKIEVDVRFRDGQEEPEIDIKSITMNEKLLNECPGIEEKPNFGYTPPDNTKLKEGCIGVGVAYDNRCRWRWGIWW